MALTAHRIWENMPSKLQVVEDSKRQSLSSRRYSTTEAPPIWTAVASVSRVVIAMAILTKDFTLV